MTPASEYLLDLATDVAKPYTAIPDLCAAMVTGSAAKGLSDQYSDIDMTMYYQDAVPSDETLDAIRAEMGVHERKWTLGSHESGWFAEAFDLHGIEVQIGHTTVAGWEKTIADTLAGDDLTSPAQKAMEGTLNSIALYGAEMMDKWKSQIADYPAELGEKMVRHHLQFFPVWGLQHHFESRDSTLWYHKILVESCEHIVATLAGLNRLYFTTFQFKRQRYFIDQMTIKPDKLAERMDALFGTEITTAAEQLEQLVGETIALVEQEMPQIDTTAAKRRLGWRQPAWGMPTLDVQFL